MTHLWLVRAEGGTHTERFIEGGYVAIGWNALGDLSDLRYYDTLVNMVNDVYSGKGQGAVKTCAEQVARFVLGIDSEDVVLTPSADYRVLRFGRIPPEGSYYFDSFGEDDDRHRFPVDWRVRPICRADLSPEFQTTMRSPRTVVSLRQHVPEFLRLVNE